MCRKSCKECPWNNKYQLNWWSKIVDKMKRKQACHMITPDIFGFKTEITDKNICKGNEKLS